VKKASGVVALLTDYGLQDAYAGTLKGAVLSVNPSARIVDLTHDIPPQDIREGSRVLEAALPYFPAGTVFVAVVDPGVGTDRAILGVETDRQVLLAPDNGLLGFLKDDVRRIVRIAESKYFLKPLSQTFHGRDIFAPVAGHLSRGADLGRFGPPAKTLATLPEDTRGRVVAIDRFGNAITNIPGDRVPRGARIKVGRTVVPSLSRTYGDVRKGALLALVGSTGYVEISVNQGSALKAGIHKGDTVTVTP
jgi:S-adenosyl-L-methionine hydrolase (adenosine-forming)